MEFFVSGKLESIISQLGSSNHVKHFPGDKLTPSQITCGQGNNVLHVAAKYRERADVEIILQSHPQLAHKTNTKGDTPLHIASRLGKLDVVKCLVEYASAPATVAQYGRLLQAVNNKRNTALHEAVLNGRYDIARLLMDEDSTLISYDNEAGESLLFLALDGGYDKIALHIVENFQVSGCSISGSNGMTVMHIAVIRTKSYIRDKQFASGSVQLVSGSVVQLLIDNFITLIFKHVDDHFVEKVIRKWGPEILEIPDDFGWMPHHYAANMGISRVLKQIFDANSCLAYMKDKEGMSALHVSAKNGHVDVIKTVIAGCPDVCELLDKKGRTALHVAVEHKQVFALHALLNTIAFDDLINEQDFEGNTALHLACINGHYKTMMPLLSDPRTNKRTINKEGLTAFDIMNESSILGPFDKFVMNSQWKIKNPRSLREAAASRYTEERQSATSPETNQSTTSVPNLDNTSTGKEKEKKNKEKSVKHTADINLLVATIIASITFTAAMTMPGGFSESTGLAHLRKRTSFRYFLAFDSLAFGCSAASMVMHFAVTVTITTNRLTNFKVQ